MSLLSRHRSVAHPASPAAEGRTRLRPTVPGLALALVSALACTWAWFGTGPASVAGAAAPAWFRVGMLGLALAGPIGLAGWVVALGRRERSSRAEGRQRQALRRQERHNLLDLLPVAVALHDARGGGAVMNRAMAHLLHVERGEAADPPLDWQQVVAVKDWPAWLRSTESALQTGRAQWLRCEMQLSGATVEVLAQIAPLDTGDGVELLVSVTLPQGEQGLAQESILQLRDLLELAEAEKWRFGQAVHDELGQRLSGIAYFAKALQHKLRDAQRVEADDAGWLTSLANESMSVARGLARGLVPVGTDDPDALAAALAELCSRVGKTFAIECTLDADPGFDPGGAAHANHLYHAVQELITNAIKHGHARHVQVSLLVLGDGQRVTVLNDGATLGESATGFGMGVSGVRSRVAYLGGQFSLADELSGGVLAAIELPRPPGSTAAPSGVGNASAADGHGDRA